MHDVFTQNRQHTQTLYTNLPQKITDFINNTHIKFNDRVKDTFIWQHNINGTYTAKSGYAWLLESSNPTAIPTKMSSWSWIWKLKIPEKFKLLIWLACHNAVPTLSLLQDRHIAPSATCSRCGEDDETLMHCLRDCNYSKIIWTNLGYTAQDFFDETAHNWLRNNATNTHSSIFLAGLWWSWRHRNQICLSHVTWPLTKIICHIHNTADSMDRAFHVAHVPSLDRLVRWNNNDYNCLVLNVDGSYLGTPTRAGYEGIIRNSAGFYITGFSGYLAASTDILFAELSAIHRGLLLAVESDYEEMVCYSDSMLSIKVVTEQDSNFHAYVVLIQDIKDLLSSRNFSIHHCLREGNQCADFLAKLGANSN